MKFIVITSIFPPTEAVKAFAEKEDYSLIVVGDKKSPGGWQCPGAEFISVDQQQQLNYKLATLLPYNHYCRKMIGYLSAMRQGAEVIIDTDDDNIPYDGWSFPGMEGEFPTIRAAGFINIYQYYTNQNIWPRGLPLRLISEKYDLTVSPLAGKVGVWQGLADEDPDVDAIYRLTSDVPCYFDKRGPVVLNNGTICPFNSQNTMFRKELFPLLYLPTYVTFRFTDILRGLVAQPIMNAAGYQLGFTEATVIQKRNPHDYFKDFESEIPMYRFCEKVIEVANGAISPGASISANLRTVYDDLHQEAIVTEKELETLEAWLFDVSVHG